MPDEISPEDRERLAKSKYREWFNECVSEWFPEAFDKRITEIAAAGEGQPSAPQPARQQSQGNLTQRERPRRRNLLEACLSGEMGW